jgi:hypothetical protein
MKRILAVVGVSLTLCLTIQPAAAQQIPATPAISLPYLQTAPVIDGDLGDWRDHAFTDGVWDINRLRHEAWFQPRRNRLTDHSSEARLEPQPEVDLAARYFTAWDDDYFYLGAQVADNVNDVDDPAHEPQRWYFKDSICWFVEAPGDDTPEQFGQGDNGLCFVIDASRPSYGAWWRHGTADASYVEEPIPEGAVDYTVIVDPANNSSGDFVLEARVLMSATLGVSDPEWKKPEVGDRLGLEIVHCDPDGGDYGGHFIIYGTGDDDETWSHASLGGPDQGVSRKTE